MAVAADYQPYFVTCLCAVLAGAVAVQCVLRVCLRSEALVRIAFMLMLGCVAALAGCESYRVEYHKRPAFYYKAAMGDLPEEIRLADGTVIKYTTYQEQSSMGRSKEEAQKPFLIREEMEDGSIVLRPITPVHVLVLFLESLRQQEYDLIWEQLLAEQTRQQFEAEGGGKDACVGYMKEHRHDLVATLTRMVAGLPAQETRFDPMGNGVVRCQLRPQHVGKLKYKYFDVTQEGLNARLFNMGG